MKLSQYFFSFFYPSFCRSCNVLVSQNVIFCEDCYSKVKPLVSVSLAVTPNKRIKVFAASNYKDPLRSLILKKSYSDALASKQLAQIMFEKTSINQLSIDYVISIPLHWTRYAKRGYNQSVVMGRVLSKRLNCEFLNVLKRKKRTIFQSKLSFEQRQLNVKNVFDINLKYKFKDFSFLKDKNILLVDDLCTTGATLKNASRVLFKFNPRSISAVVGCRVV